MLFNDRATIILQQIQLNSSVKISELVDILNVSVDTVRRDLKIMEQKGLIKYVRGGACLPETVAAIENFSGREVININLKRESALKAVGYIKKGSVIALNSGTTNTIIAQEIVKRFDDITVITNNIAVINVLMQKPSINIISTGGNVDSMEKSFYGFPCEETLNNYFPDICFLSINAFNYNDGYTDFRINEEGPMKIMFKNSKKVIAVMDSTKIGKRSKFKVFDCNDIEKLIIDNNISDNVKEIYIKKGINIE